MAKNFKELEAKMPPESRARAKAMAAEVLLYGTPLDELRGMFDMTQTSVAKSLGVGQAEVSKIEGRADMYVSTLARYVKALGGELEIFAVFPEHPKDKVKIRHFQELASGPQKPR